MFIRLSALEVPANPPGTYQEKARKCRKHAMRVTLRRVTGPSWNTVAVTSGGGSTERSDMTPRTYELYIPRALKAVLVLSAIFSVCMPIGLLALPLDGPPLAVRLLVPAVLAFAWYRACALPHRIVMHSDQRIEFIGIFQRCAVPASQILAVRSHRSQLGFLVLQHTGGKILILSQFTGFHKLLSELEAVNPGIEFLGCQHNQMNKNLFSSAFS